MLNAYRASLLLLATGWLWGILAMIQGPQAPTFQRAPSFLSERDELHVELRIEPHPDIRAVVLEAWRSGQDADFGCLRDPLALVRGSSEPVNELNAAQRTFPFHWRQSLKEGCFVLLAKAVLPTGLTKERKHSLEVR